MSATINEDNEFPKCEACGCQGDVLMIAEDLVHYSPQFDMWLCDFCEQLKWMKLREENTPKKETPNTTGRAESPS